MALVRRIASALLILVAARSPCQEAAGKRVDLSFDMAGLRASAVNVGAGIDIARFLGLGVLWGMGFAVDGTTDLEAGLWCTAALLTEGEMGLPVTLVITGSFAKIRALGAALDQQSLVRSGTAATLGIEVSKTFAASERVGFLTALEASYRYTTITTEAVAGSGSTFQTLIVPSADLRYGIKLGLVAKMTEQVRVLMGLRAGLDGQFGLHFGPLASLISR